MDVGIYEATVHRHWQTQDDDPRGCSWPEYSFDPIEDAWRTDGTDAILHCGGSPPGDPAWLIRVPDGCGWITLEREGPEGEILAVQALQYPGGRGGVPARLTAQGVLADARHYHRHGSEVIRGIGRNPEGDGHPSDGPALPAGQGEGRIPGESSEMDPGEEDVEDVQRERPAKLLRRTLHGVERSVDPYSVDFAPAPPRGAERGEEGHPRPPMVGRGRRQPDRRQLDLLDLGGDDTDGHGDPEGLVDKRGVRRGKRD